ncbi:MAG: bifunctional phosphoglucose/phosphomannose isomerase, partial [Hydrogenobaculum sp.]
PRYALGFMLNACLWLFGKEEEILDLKEDLKASSSHYEEISKDIAKGLFGYVPIIYGTPLTEAAAYRFKTQINENSKTPAYNAYIPEMHHNEVVGYTNPDINQYLRFVIVADKKEHPRVSLRVNMTIDILKDKGFNPILISEEGNSYISRLLKNIYIGDFASYHLANMYGYDPLPVDIITYVKKRLQDG